MNADSDLLQAPINPGRRRSDAQPRRRLLGGVVTRYLHTHWRGRCPLARSLWLHTVLLGGLACVLASALSVLVDITAGPVRLAALAALLAWPLALAVLGWGLVGTWRSAGRWARKRPAGAPGPAWVALGTRGLLAAIALAALGLAAWRDVPRAPTLLRLAISSDPQGQATITPSADGRQLRLSGWLASGDADRIRQALAAAPAVRVLELDLAGGRFQEAQHVAAALKGQGWTVRVKGACVDACTLLLAAGQVRQLMPKARWSVARPAPVTANPLFKPWVKQRLAALYVDGGLPPQLVGTGLALPHDFDWHAGWNDLAEAGVVTTLPYPLDIPLPRGSDAPLAEWTDALLSHPRWHRLDQRFPGTVAATAERLRSARAGGADDGATMLAGLETIEPLLAQLLFNASPELREQFAQLLLQAMQAAREDGSNTCVRLLAGDATARRAMAPALALREAAWMADAAAETPRTTPPRTPSGIELEVVRRWLGGEAPALLASLRRPGDAGARHCDRISTLLTHVLQLPPGERRLALRMAFERP